MMKLVLLAVAEHAHGTRTLHSTQKLNHLSAKYRLCFKKNICLLSLLRALSLRRARLHVFVHTRVVPRMNELNRENELHT